MKKLKALALLTVMTLPVLAKQELSYYNLLDNGLAPNFEEQVWGTCWAFSSTYSMESNLLLRNKEDFNSLNPIGLSPYHMDKFSGFTRRGNKNHVRDDWYSGQGNDYSGSNRDDLDSGLVVHLGGDYKVAASYLSHNGGAINKWSLPKLTYFNKPHEKFSRIKRDDSLYRKYMPTSIEWLSSSNQIETIKNAIVKNGAVATLQHMNSEPYSYAYDANEVHYYYGDKKPTHALNIIGWDDQMALPPLSPGMWIVQDSDHVDEYDLYIGKFYIPYADKYVGQSNEHGPVQFLGVSEFNYSNIHSHALHGWTNTVNGFEKVKNRYGISDTEKIKGISFYNVSKMDRIKIEVFDSRGQKPCGKSIEESFNNIGFYYIDLNCSPYKGNIDIVISSLSRKYATDGTKLFDLLLGTELPKVGEAVLVKSKASPGESFYYKNKKWYDFYSYKWSNHKVEGKIIKRNKTGNFSINLYTEEANE